MGNAEKLIQQAEILRSIKDGEIAPEFWDDLRHQVQLVNPKNFHRKKQAQIEGLKQDLVQLLNTHSTGEQRYKLLRELVSLLTFRDIYDRKTLAERKNQASQ